MSVVDFPTHRADVLRVFFRLLPIAKMVCCACRVQWSVRFISRFPGAFFEAPYMLLRDLLDRLLTYVR